MRTRINRPSGSFGDREWRAPSPAPVQPARSTASGSAAATSAHGGQRLAHSLERVEIGGEEGVIQRKPGARTSLLPSRPTRYGTFEMAPRPAYYGTFDIGPYQPVPRSPEREDELDEMEREPEISPSDKLHQRTAELYSRQREIHEWYRDAESTGIGKDDERYKKMDRRMDRLQKKFRRHIGKLVESGDDLRVPGLEPSEHEEVQDLWRNLVGGRGRISIDKGDSGERAAAFRNEVLTSFARLMPSATARKVIGRAQSGEHDITFKSAEPGTTHDLEPGSQPLYPDRALLKSDLPSVLKMDERRRHQKYSDHQLKGRSPDPGIHRANTGSPSDIWLPPDLADSTLKTYSRRGRDIPGPSYTTLSHELIHSLHAQKGTNRSDLDPKYLPSELVRGSTPEEEWTDYEEYKTITKQNKIDAELGLPERWGHGGGLHLSAEERRRRMESVGYETFE